MIVVCASLCVSVCAHARTHTHIKVVRQSFPNESLECLCQWRLKHTLKLQTQPLSAERRVLTDCLERDQGVPEDH